MRFFQLLFIACVLQFVSVDAVAQSDDRTIESSPRATIKPRKERVTLNVGLGLMPTFLVGGNQLNPVIHVTGQYYLNPRLAIGVNYAQSESESNPVQDFNKVTSWMNSKVTHIGARMTGSIVRTGALEIYGGLQLGLNFTNASFRHEFPAGGQIENEEEYIANRPNPFGEPRTQISPVGFFGATVEVLPHAHLNVEFGNNLSLAVAGVELRF